jgi:hypothetical protein
MTVTGSLTFTNVSTKNMAEIFESVKTLQEVTQHPYRVYVQGHGATRKGEIIFLNGGKWYELVDEKATLRKQFFNVKVDETLCLIRPENDTFSAVKISFE